MKKIGLKQNNQESTLLKLNSHKVKLPIWIDEIQEVLHISSAQNKDILINNIDYYIKNADPVSLSSDFMYDRNTYEAKYFLRDGYIHSSLEDDYLVIIFTSVPITEEGDILLQEEIHLIEALVWYNVKEYLWRAMMRNPNQYAQLYQLAEREWIYYSINAKTASIFPKNKDELKALRNKYLRIISNVKI